MLTLCADLLDLCIHQSKIKQSVDNTHRIARVGALNIAFADLHALATIDRIGLDSYVIESGGNASAIQREFFVTML